MTPIAREKNCMRVIFVTVSLLLWAWGRLAAQNPLDKRLDLSADRLALEEVLYLLMEEGDVPISFSNQLLPSEVRITLYVQNERLETILQRIFQGTHVGYRVVGDRIVLIRVEPPPPRKLTISGYVRDQSSGEPLISANVYDPIRGRGTVTNSYGFFSLTLDEGLIHLYVSYLGYQNEHRQLTLLDHQRIDIELVPSLTLNEVVVLATQSGGRLSEISPVSKNSMTPDEMEAMPALGGEADVLRFCYTLPGVQTGADGFGGMAVRGGNVDQNLVLLDGVPVYNSNHLLGIYSVFNTSAIRSTQLLKGGFPARYGGRISSVLDVRTKEGNMKEFAAEGDLGLTSGKITIEGPILRDKSSFFLSGRRSFLDLYSRPVSRRIRERNGFTGELGYYFFDLNGKVNTRLGQKDRLYLSLYSGGDDYDNQVQLNQTAGDTTLVEDSRQAVFWGNTISALRWNHLFSDKLFMNATGTFSRFFYQSRDLLDDVTFVNFQPISRDYVFYEYRSNNRDWAGKLDFDYMPNPDNYVRFGLCYTAHRFQPGAIAFDEAFLLDSLTEDSINILLDKSALRSYEYEGYVENEFWLDDHFSANLGLRMAVYEVHGRVRVYPQPRVHFSYCMNERLTFNLALGKSVQSLHLLSNSGAGLPRDLWVSSTERIAPIESWQFVGGPVVNLAPGWKLQAEGYFKLMNNLITFQEGSLAEIDATNWQNKVSVGSGRAYGAELFLEKKQGNTTGWLSYTLAFADRKFEDVNLGKRFPYRFDRRHNVNLQVNHRFEGRPWQISLGWTFSTGSATTLPRSSYQFNQLNLLYTNFPPQFPFVLQASENGSRNDIRLPAYHRLDLSATYQLKTSWGEQEFVAGVYNAYNRLNPVYYLLVDRPNEQGVLVPQYSQLSLLPIVPSLRYRVRF